MERYERIAALIIRRSEIGLTALEEQTLQAWVEQDPLHRQPLLERTELADWAPKLRAYFQAKADEAAALTSDLDRSLDRMRAAAVFTPAAPTRTISRYWIAAAVFLLLVGGGLWWRTLSIKDASYRTLALSDTSRGLRQTAVLTLSNQQKITLDAKDQHRDLQDSGVTIQHQGTGLVYSSSPGKTVSHNSLYVPRSSQYSVTLPDGTRVWLNANTTLTYPTSFSGSAREVQITGEAYFEVARQNIPFVVRTSATRIRVLGTHFNVNDYASNFITTTLVEGSVEIDFAGNLRVLAPNYQGIANLVSGDIMVRPANMEQALAWREGRFYFKEDALEDIMENLARWYAFKPVFRGKVNGKYSGVFSRTKPLEKILSMLALDGGFTYKIQPNDVVEITPQ